MENALNALGWNDFFQAGLLNIPMSDFRVARVCSENKTNYNVRTEKGELSAEVTGRMLFTSAPADLPKVGDWVVITDMDDYRAIIHAVLKRKSVLSRKEAGRTTTEQVVVVNIDVLFIVQALDDDFSPARLERYLAAAKHMTPVVVLNKTDLCQGVDEKVRAVKERLPGVPIVKTSATGGNIEALRGLITSGKTAAFVGSSGVGKSSLINALIGGTELRTGDIRESDSKGRHTTTRRQMIFLPAGGIVIDTPGMREFQPWDGEQHLSSVFSDIAELSRRCHFSDCTHVHETGCAVTEAVASGGITADHYNNYLKLKREMEYQQALVDTNKARERKQQHKQRIKAYKKIVRNKRGGD